MIHTCLTCKTEFSKKGTKPAKYCSRKCYSAAGRIKKNCSLCGKEFEVIQYRNTQEFCSIACGQAGKKSNQIELKKTLQKRYGVDHPSQLQEFKEKANSTIQKKYGDRSVLIEKSKAAKVKKYGDPFYFDVQKMSKTKLQKYGTSTYNNREKFKETMMSKYQSLQSPTQKEVIKRGLENKSIGFNSKQYKNFLKSKGVSNISFLPEIVEKKRNIALKKSYARMFVPPFSEYCVPLFSLENFKGCVNYETYPFRCTKCQQSFFGWARNGVLPRCPTCFPPLNGTSQGEQELLDFIKSIYSGPVEQKNRTLVAPREIDIFLPELNLAFEYNGLYWHSELAGKDRNYHVSKTNLCEKAGVRLVQIFEPEWEFKKEILQSFIKKLLNVPCETFMGRKLAIVEYSKFNEPRQFLANHHIQGEGSGSVYYGLFDGGELLAVMSFSKSRYSTRYEWEINRFAIKSDTKILGGGEKLFSAFVRDYNPQSVISFSDRRLFQGNIYQKLGFVLDHISAPNYFYFKEPALLLESRLKYQKHKLASKLINFDASKTEWENMQLNGYNRIWDCGNVAWIWKSAGVEI